MFWQLLIAVTAGVGVFAVCSYVGVRLLTGWDRLNQLQQTRTDRSDQ